MSGLQVECWRGVRSVPAHKQRRLFDVDREAERALHDLANIAPPMLLHQVCVCV